MRTGSQSFGAFALKWDGSCRSLFCLCINYPAHCWLIGWLVDSDHLQIRCQPRHLQEHYALPCPSHRRPCHLQDPSLLPEHLGPAGCCHKRAQLPVQRKMHAQMSAPDLNPVALHPLNVTLIIAPSSASLSSSAHLGVFCCFANLLKPVVRVRESEGSEWPSSRNAAQGY